MIRSQRLHTAAGAIAPLIVLTRLRRLLLVDAAAAVPVVAIVLLRDGRHLRTIGRGEGFGEIGLIRNIERTATVTAMTDAVLLSIERGPFITAVTGHPESLQRADAIIDELLPTTRAYDLL